MLTQTQISEQIQDVQYHHFDGTTVTICCITLINGFNVTGASACVIPAEYDEHKGREIAFNKAVDKIWELEGYLLKEELHIGGSCVRNTGVS